MTIGLFDDSGTIRLLDFKGELTPAARSALRLMGFQRTKGGFSLIYSSGSDQLVDAVTLLRDEGISVELDETVSEVLSRKKQAVLDLVESQRLGQAIKNGDLDLPVVREFFGFAQESLARPLLPHQVKAAIHLLVLAHGANFSVPGAGKTAVVVSVYEFLRSRGRVNCVFVVGPRSCFAAWQTEFEDTVGRPPVAQALAGGDVSDRRQIYYAPRTTTELFLTTYHTLARDTQHVEHLLRSRNRRALFVIDEAHYMKQEGGVWAGAVAAASRHAVKRCLLTGTPFPKNYADGINLFEALYPNGRLLSGGARQRIRTASDLGRHGEAKRLLEPAITGLYYRVRKSELELSTPMFLSPIGVDMGPVERELYDAVEKRICELGDQQTDQDLETILQLKRGRQIRRRQAVSYAALLLSAVEGYTEELIGTDGELREKIANYDAYEVPGKVQRIVKEVQSLVNAGEKVVVWANFVGSLHLIEQHLRLAGVTSAVVFGGTPTEPGMGFETRDEIIGRFKSAASGLDVLVANPAACAESVSLHKTCSNAIYYDLSYNCAQYLQSLDRIHRVGGSERKISYYRFLQYRDTFESDILENLAEKAARMSDVIDQEFPLAMEELSSLGIALDGIEE